MKMPDDEFDFMFAHTEMNNILGYAAIYGEEEHCLYYEGVHYGVVFDSIERITLDFMEKSYFLATLNGVCMRLNASDILNQDVQCQN